jgi:hypothetical protein
MSIDRLTALATLAKLEADAAPEGAIRKVIMEAAKGLAMAVTMLDDVAAGHCPGCGKPPGQANPKCDHPAGCGRRPMSPEFTELLARTVGAAAAESEAQAPASSSAGKKAAATRAARKAAA